MLQKLSKKNEKGFTLIELMIVIAIIGILAAIAIPNFIQYRKRAYEKSALADCKNAYTAAMSYQVDHPSIPINSYNRLTEGGFRSTANVTVTAAGSGTDFTVTSKHDSGDYTFSITQDGASTSGS